MLRKSYDELQAHASIIEAMGQGEAKHLDDPKRLKTVLGKLPRDIVFGWTKYRVENGISTDLTYFCHSLCKRVTIAEKAEIETHFTDIDFKKFSGIVVKGEVAEEGSSHYSAKRSTKEKQNEFCWVCQSDLHCPEDCGTFKTLTVDKRRSMVMSKGACVRCSGKNQVAPKCRKKFLECEVADCTEKARHHTLLHRNLESLPEQNGILCYTLETEDINLNGATCGTEICKSSSYENVGRNP